MSENASVVLDYVAPELSGDSELISAIVDATEEILARRK